MSSRKAKQTKYNYCSFNGCHNNNTRYKRFFRFPREERRSKLWVELSGKPSLLDTKTEQLWKSNRLCEDHFKDWCFLNENDRGRLVFNAVPCIEKSEVPPEVLSPSSLIPPKKDASPFIKIEKISQQSPTVELAALNVAKSAQQPQLPINIIPTNNLQPFTFQSGLQIVKIETIRLENGSKGITVRKLNKPTLNNTPQNSKAKVTSLRAKLPSVPAIRRSRKYTPEMSNMAKLLKRKSDLLRQTKIRMEKLKAQVEGMKKPAGFRERFLGLGVSEKMADFVIRQMELDMVQDPLKRYTDEEKVLGYSIFCQSKAAYKIIRNVIHLPCISVLHSTISQQRLDSTTDDNLISTDVQNPMVILETEETDEESELAEDEAFDDT